MAAPRMLVTGANGMVGRHVVREALRKGYDVRAFVRKHDDQSPLRGLDVEIVTGDLTEPECIPPALADMEYVVHTAGMVGDWGPMADYRAINQTAVESILAALAKRGGPLKRFVHISSLGVYRWEDHHGEDETIPPDYIGYDGYTTTKAQAELICQRYIKDHKLPIVVIRPGFMYGEGDRHVLPRIVETLRAGTLMMIGDGKKVLDNLYVGSLAEAVMLAADKDVAIGQIYNIRDERLVDRNEYVGTVAKALGVRMPRRAPYWLARAAIKPMHYTGKALGFTKPPLLTKPRFKFMALNLEYSIAKAKRELGYAPTVDFQDGIKIALDPYVPKQAANAAA